MPRLTLIYPCMGRFSGDRYVRSWQMQPLAMAVLAALTPPEWEVTFFDDRMEEVNIEHPADLVGISIEAYSARRGYQLAAEYRRRGVPVVLGGFHATFCPEEALEHADAVCVGEAEPVWGRILADAVTGRMRGYYQADAPFDLHDIPLDRSVFRNKRYMPLTLVETGRGCPFRCDFCSVSAFYGARHRHRPIADIVEELRRLRAKHVFFVDDNLVGDLHHAEELFHALKPLKVGWFSQASINAARDEAFLRLMAESGCLGLLVGFESLAAENLQAMDKGINRLTEYREALARFRRVGIAIYGTFIFGYPHDTPSLFEQTLAFAREEKLFIAAFNHLVPFPGTPLYQQLEAEGRLCYPKWWLHEDYRFGQPPFVPVAMTADEIEAGCYRTRHAFYQLNSILYRNFEPKANCRGIGKALAFWGINLLLRREVDEKRGIPLGLRDEREAP